MTTELVTPGIYAERHTLYYWNTGTLAYEVATVPTAGTGGGGDASAANQTTEIARLTSIDGKTPALGQATAANAVPVVLTALQVAALTPPAAITGYALDATVAKDGTDISAPTAMPAGGVGIRGWLSAIWTKLNGSLAVTGTFWPATQPVSGTVTANAGTGTMSVADSNLDVALSTRLKPADTLAGVTAVGSITNALPAGTNLIGQAQVPPATLCVTAVSAANAAVTCTLPAVAAQFHYLSRIVIERVATAAITGTATLTYTSTNLPGSWARTTGNAAPVGQQMKDVDECLGSELKSSVVNTATTIVAPAAGATGIVRITVYYRAAV